MWKRLPGNWDPLHFSACFPSENEWGIPTIARDEQRIPSHLIQWGSRPQLDRVTEESNTAIHFFLDDYRFESVWNNPRRSLDALSRIGLVLSPDFSLWRDMPMAMQIWQVYRNRWLGRYWQECGISVIPTIGWSDSQSFDFCFLGVEMGSIVAISTVGVTADATARRLFRKGFEQMVDVIKPSAILCYGRLVDLTTDVLIVTFPTRWEEKEQRKRQEAWQTPNLWEAAS